MILFRPIRKTAISTPAMLPITSLLLLALWAACAVSLSTTGNRLLVVLDDAADSKLYSQFFGDLEARGFRISFETPKSESVALFQLGERAYDHALFFPTKAKGAFWLAVRPS